MFTKIASLVIAFSFLASFAFAADGYETYTIQKGDTLTKIAQNELKDAKYLPQLISYNIKQNVIATQNDLKVGTALRIPFSLSKNRAAELTMTVGNVAVTRSGSSQQESAAKGMTLLQSDTVVTAAGAKAEIQLDEGSVVRVGPKTQFAIKSYGYADGNRSTNLDLKQGSMSMKVTKLTGSADFQVSTVTAVAGVRGTFFYVNYDPDSNEVGIAVYSGQVVVGQDTNKDGFVNDKDKSTITVPAGHATTVSKEGVPSPVIEIPAKIKWADE